jgi:SPP1 gp7 family putative phage head morphogenesis protein
MATAGFSIPDKLEITYRSLISQIVKSWIPVRLKDSSPEHWLRELASVSTRNSVISASTKLAVNMITKINTFNVKSWREAALKAHGGYTIHKLLQQELYLGLSKRIHSVLEENAKYMADIPHDVAVELYREITKAQQIGERPETVALLLKTRFPQIMSSKIAMISRTQISRSSTALTRARSEQLSLPAFVWDTSKDQRVRPSHRKLNGVVVFWKDLPSPEQLVGLKPYLGHYAPGDCPNCRCYPRPILTLEDIFSSSNSRVRVYMRGEIAWMSRSQFQKLSGIESRIAA